MGNTGHSQSIARSRDQWEGERKQRERDCHAGHAFLGDLVMRTVHDRQRDDEHKEQDDERPEHRMAGSALQTAAQRDHGTEGYPLIRSAAPPTADVHEVPLLEPWSDPVQRAGVECSQRAYVDMPTGGAAAGCDDEYRAAAISARMDTGSVGAVQHGLRFVRSPFAAGAGWRLGVERTNLPSHDVFLDGDAERREPRRLQVPQAADPDRRAGRRSVAASGGATRADVCGGRRAAHPILDERCRLIGR